MRRAVRNQGFFPANVERPDQFVDIAAAVMALREQSGRDTTEPYDKVTALPPGTDPAAVTDLNTWEDIRRSGHLR